ncbi:MAG: hypothetical protein WDM91_08645 [Rhizomicrobium sp.]
MNREKTVDVIGASGKKSHEAPKLFGVSAKRAESGTVTGTCSATWDRWYSRMPNIVPTRTP